MTSCGYLPQLFPDWAAVQVWTRLDPGPLTALLRNELPRAHPAFRMTDVTQPTLADNFIAHNADGVFSKDSQSASQVQPINPCVASHYTAKVSPVLGGWD